jgi:ribosomal protein S18 acetylase RimI-like enzyme
VLNNSFRIKLLNASFNKIRIKSEVFMIIERAGISDAEEILMLQKRAYQSEDDLYPEFTIPPMEQTLDEIISEYEDHLFFKAIRDNRIVGSVRVSIIDSETCYMGRLIVDPDLQNQGIGTILMEEAEQIFSKYPRIVLMTGQRSKNNIKFYIKRGYKIFKIKSFNESLRFICLEKNRL